MQFKLPKSKDVKPSTQQFKDPTGNPVPLRVDTPLKKRKHSAVFPDVQPTPSPLSSTQEISAEDISSSEDIEQAIEDITRDEIKDWLSINAAALFHLEFLKAHAVEKKKQKEQAKADSKKHK